MWRAGCPEAISRNNSVDDAPVTSKFVDQNPGLSLLPQQLLCHESEVLGTLAAVESMDTPLEEKVRLLDSLGILPFTTGSRLRHPIRLFIDIADDLSRLTIYKLEKNLSEQELNGPLDLSGKEMTRLVEIPSPDLIFSCNAIQRHAGRAAAEGITQLFIYGRRLTRYLGVTVSWDQSIDQSVWTTNIDTVNFLRALSESGTLSRTDVRRAMEVGVGGGGISKTLVAKLPRLEEMTATDISAHALLCAKRNIEPLLGTSRRLNLYLGKGIRNLNEKVDLLVVNPPYIPTVQEPDKHDPYRGTGLIKEVIEIGVDLLNPDNPDSCIYMGMSSLAAGHLERYLSANPGIEASPVTEPMRVPLKILDVNENRAWIDFLVSSCGLVHSTELLEETGFPYWHDLSVLRLTRRH